MTNPRKIWFISISNQISTNIFRISSQNLVVCGYLWDWLVEAWLKELVQMHL